MTTLCTPDTVVGVTFCQITIPKAEQLKLDI